MENNRTDNQDVAEPDQIASGMAGTGQETAKDNGIHGELAFYFYDRQERIADRLNNKIGQLEQRVTALEERGRE